MSLVLFDSLPDTARVWCFGSDRDLTDTEAAALEASMAAFVDQWTAHDQRLAGGFTCRDRRFLLVAVDEGVEQASGCSIDSLLRHLEGLESELSTSLTDGRLVWFRTADGAVRSVMRAEFRDLAGRATSATIHLCLTCRSPASGSCVAEVSSSPLRRVGTPVTLAIECEPADRARRRRGIPSKRSRR